MAKLIRPTLALNKVRLRRFKCFHDSGELSVRPLTLIFGRNNSGKSTIIQSLLLLRQSLDSFESGPRLNLRGPLYSAGSFSDIAHQHKSSNSVSFDIELNFQSRTGAFHFEFTSDEPRAPRLSRLEITFRSHSVEVKRGRGSGGPYELWADGALIGKERKHFSTARFLPVFFGPMKAPLDEADNWLRRLRRLLLETRAIGPFRRQPSRRYEFQGKPPDAPDILGEFAIDALIDDETRRSGGKLLRDINAWLTPLARVKLLPLRNTSSTSRIYEVRVRDLDSKRWANLADVGSGIGHALPLLIEGLRTAPGGTFIVQEPETHLHPDAQLAVADFLMYLAKTGRTVIAETHSDLVLLRLRRRMLETALAKSKAKKPPEINALVVGSSAKAKNVSLGEYGQIEWPKGFMEDANEERLEFVSHLAAAAEKGAKA